jgi:hypothetical protein
LTRPPGQPKSLAIIWSQQVGNKPQIADDAILVKVEIEPNQLIQAVHVSPLAPQWFGELVEALMCHYSLQCPIIRSNLYDRPSY